MPRPVLTLVIAILTAAAVAAGGARAGRRLETAVFAGGCFWSMEHDMRRTPGVVDVQAGYTGGSTPHPSYEDVSTERTGHYEAVRVTFDASKTSYADLLGHYWRMIDPTDAGGAFCDRGPSYRSAIFVAGPEQAAAAQASLAALERGPFKGRIRTEIRPASSFWPAEGWHQNYAEKNPLEYGSYRYGCGKDRRLHQIWGPEALR